MRGAHYDVQSVDFDDEELTTTLTFYREGELKELFGKPFEIEFRIATQFLPVRFVGTVETKKVKNGRLAQYMSRIKEKIPFMEKNEESSQTKQILLFTLDEVCSADACFRLRPSTDQSKGMRI